MSVTGNGQAQMAKLRENLRKVASAGLTRDLAQVLGVASMKLVDDGFRLQADPYGKAWQPFSPNTRRRRGKMSSAKLMQDTGRMRASKSFVAEDKGFRIMIPVKYAPVHQYGATIHARSNVRGQKLRGRYTKTGQFRFVKKGQAGILINAKRATFGETKIPQRQMIPMASTGGLGERWTKVFNGEASALLRRRLQVAA